MWVAPSNTKATNGAVRPQTQVRVAHSTFGLANLAPHSNLLNWLPNASVLVFVENVMISFGLRTRSMCAIVIGAGKQD